MVSRLPKPSFETPSLNNHRIHGQLIARVGSSAAAPVPKWDRSNLNSSVRKNRAKQIACHRTTDINPS